MIPARIMLACSGLLLWVAGCTFFIDSSGADFSLLPTGQPVVEEIDFASASISTLFDGVKFSFDASLAEAGTAQQVPQFLDPSGFIAFDLPNHYRFEFLGAYTGQPPFLDFQPRGSLWTAHQNLTTPLLQPQVFIFPVGSFEAISPLAAERIDLLRALLNGKPLPPGAELPVLPMFNSAQDLQVQLKSIDFLNGGGIRFVTRYAQDASPVTNPTVFYTFQGLTDDGQFYVAAFFPIYVPHLPDEITVKDWESFNLMYPDYLYQLTQDLDVLSAPEFVPDLALLDALIASIEVQPRTLMPGELRLGSGRTGP